MAFVDLAAGAEFAGRYRIVRRLASGGMGTVYEVVHLETERRRALKVMQSDLFQNAALRERFRNEARVTAQVRSDSLVDVFDAGVDAATGMPFLVMELLIGEDLGRRVERLGPLPVEEVIAYLTQVAGALDRTHAASIVHRDLKPANLFLAELEDGSTRVKILDFGISKIVSEATSEGVTSRTLGTPAYMAPEQLLGEPVSAATDIHALGLIAYTFLAGESYWQKDVESVDNVFALALRAQEGPRESPLVRAARLGRTLPEAFGAWFERATAREPKARFERASSAVAALAEALGAKPAVFASSSHSMSVETPIPAERVPLTGVRWLAVPALLLVALGLFSLFGPRATSAPTLPSKPEPSAQHATLPSARLLAPPTTPSAAPAASLAGNMPSDGVPKPLPAREPATDRRPTAAHHPRPAPPAPAKSVPSAATATPTLPSAVPSPPPPPPAPAAPRQPEKPSRHTRD